MTDTNTLLQIMLALLQTTNNNISLLASRVQSLEGRIAGEKSEVPAEVRRPDAIPASVPSSYVLKPEEVSTEEVFTEEVSTPQVAKKTTTFEYPFTDPPAPTGMDMFGPTGLPNTPHRSKDSGNQQDEQQPQHDVQLHLPEDYYDAAGKNEGAVYAEGEQDPNQRDDVDQNEQFDPGGEN